MGDVIDENMVEPIPCALIIDRHGRVHIYDMRASDDGSLIASFTILNPKDEKSGFAMLSFFGHLRKQWLEHLRREMVRLWRKSGNDLRTIHSVKRLRKKWRGSLHWGGW